MIEINREFKGNFDSFEFPIKDMGSEEVEIVNGVANELQSECRQATEVESNKE